MAIVQKKKRKKSNEEYAIKTPPHYCVLRFSFLVETGCFVLRLCFECKPYPGACESIAKPREKKVLDGFPEAATVKVAN